MGVCGQLTTRENGSFFNNRSVDFWYCLISLKAFVPGRYRRCAAPPTPVEVRRAPVMLAGAVSAQPLHLTLRISPDRGVKARTIRWPGRFTTCGAPRRILGIFRPSARTRRGGLTKGRPARYRLGHSPRHVEVVYHRFCRMHKSSVGRLNAAKSQLTPIKECENDGRQQDDVCSIKTTSLSVDAL